MKWFASTLWDLFQRDREAGSSGVAVAGATTRRPRGTAMQDRYDRLVVEMKRTYSLRVRKWRSSSTGCAWEVHYANGSVSRLIEAPYPRGPMSCVIFLHEVGHHAIGFGRYRPRCLEEYHAWRWAIEQMRERGFNVTGSVQRRMAESLRYAVEKARRRGLRRVPAELAEYLAFGISHQPSAIRGGEATCRRQPEH